jgi:guanylate kinase
MAAALDELSHYAEFDYLVINDQFSAALEALAGSIVIANRQRREAQLDAPARTVDGYSCLRLLAYH